MPKINVFALKRPTRQKWQFTLNDGVNPEVVLQFNEPGISELTEINTLSEEKCAFYDAGAPLPAVDGVPLKYSRELMQVACAMSVLHIAENDFDRYSPEEFLCMIEAMETQMVAIIGWVNKKAEEYYEATKNPTGAVIIP
jgi:hypothetical protein